MYSKKPLVSVLMPVYNAEDFLAEALESILSQTYTNIEIITVDDCSTDSSFSLLQKFAKKNPCITVLKNKTHAGINASMNTAITHAQGYYLARMDADDIALPKRLENQVNYLRLHKCTVAVGGNFFIINEESKITGKRIFPQNFVDIYSYTFSFVAISQPAMMIAKNRLPKNFVFFDPRAIWADDVELVFKLFLYGKVENLSETILLYRMRDKSHSLKNPKKTFYHTLFYRIKAVIFYKYHPPLLGIVINFLQLIAVSLLPNSLILLLYKKIRNKPIIATKTPSLLNIKAAFS